MNPLVSLKLTLGLEIKLFGPIFVLLLTEYLEHELILRIWEYFGLSVLFVLNFLSFNFIAESNA